MSISLGILFLAVFIEGFIEYAFADRLKKRYMLKYIALALGVVCTVAYNVDLFAMVGLTSSVPFIGSVLSGLIIGRGSNYLNDIMSKFRSTQA